MITRVAFTGKMCSGKDTAASYLINKYGFRQLSFADPIRRLAKEVYGDVQTNERRRFMQEVGQAGRAVDPLVWVRPVANIVTSYPDVPYVISDVRFPNEAKALERLNFKIIRIVASEAVRIQRHVMRNGYAPSPSALNNESETALDGIRFPEINGELPLDVFYSEIDRFILGL